MNQIDHQHLFFPEWEDSMRDQDSQEPQYKYKKRVRKL